MKRDFARLRGVAAVRVDAVAPVFETERIGETPHGLATVGVEAILCSCVMGDAAHREREQGREAS